MTNRQTQLRVFYDPEEDCFGYSYMLDQNTPEDLIRILAELNGFYDDILNILKEKLKNEA